MNAETRYEQDYLPYIIRWGRLTNWTGVFLSFGPVLVLAAVFGIIPPFQAILNGFISIAGAVGIIWFVEPLSYFPIVGVSGTYMAFISGNISNLRIPCALVAQKIAGVEAGTREGSIIATLGMAVSIVVNTVILTAGVLAGAQVLSMMPPAVNNALQLLLPALFGAIFVQFAIMKPKMAPIVLALCLLITLAARKGLIPGTLSTVGAVFLSIALGVLLYKKGLVK